MKRQWLRIKKYGFTIVELIIVIVVVGLLTAIVVVSYSGVQKYSAERVMQSDLDNATGEMQRLALSNNGVYPTTLPATITPSPKVILVIKQSSTTKFYANNGPLSPVQNGVLMAEICQDLINEGVGKGIDQGGVSRDYITGCGNWNHDSMQISGYDNKIYATPVSDITLLNYADTFTTNDAYNKARETTVKNFYHQLVDRHLAEGGTYPITSFWDYWATPNNGGVVVDPLPASSTSNATYCIEATHATYPDLKWHVSQDAKLKKGSC